MAAFYYFGEQSTLLRVVGLGKKAWLAVNEDRKVHLSPTIIDGRFILRFAVLNRRTTTDHVDHAIDIIEKTLAG